MAVPLIGSPQSRSSIVFIVGIFLFAVSIFREDIDQQYGSLRQDRRSLTLESDLDSVRIPEHPDKRPLLTMERIIQNIPASDIDKNKNRTSTHSLSNCIPTSQFSLSYHDDDKTSWLLRTYGPDGKQKNSGGDELYITYKDEAINDTPSPNAIARITDHNNGSYRLRFYESQSFILKDHDKMIRSDGVGTIEITLIYTCGTGNIEPPNKNTWSENGAINVIYKTQVPTPPPILPRDKPRQYPELANYGVIHAIGDSTMREFTKLYNYEYYRGFKRKQAACNSRKARRSNMIYQGQTGGPLNLVYIERMKKKVDSVIINSRENGFEDASISLLLGSCIWELYAIHNKESLAEDKNHIYSYFEMDDHLDAISSLIQYVRNNYPLVANNIYWKGCTATHRNKWTEQESNTNEGIRYISSSRSQKLDFEQKKVLSKFNIPILDMYDVTYDMFEMLSLNDVRHYNDVMNKHLIDYFYPTSSNGSEGDVTGKKTLETKNVQDEEKRKATEEKINKLQWIGTCTNTRFIVEKDKLST